MDDLFIALWPPAWLEDHTLSDEQLVAAGDDVKQPKRRRWRRGD